MPTNLCLPDLIQALQDVMSTVDKESHHTIEVDQDSDGDLCFSYLRYKTPQEVVNDIKATTSRRRTEKARLLAQLKCLEDLDNE
jgi:hypothetical protein